VLLDFDGKAIYKHGMNGPYDLKYLVLYDENGTLMDTLNYAYTTSAYNYTDFQYLVLLTGVYSDYGTDTDGDGLYNYLTVDIGAKVAADGNCFIYARLMDINETEIVWASNVTFLYANQTQTIQLNFDGKFIHENMVDGPYYVRDVYIYHQGDPTQSDYVYDAYTTNAYNYTEFQPKPPITVALISDNSELLTITSLLDSIGIGYDTYNDNRIHNYTANVTLLNNYTAVIFCNNDRSITSSEHSALEAYLSSGGNLLVTGYDSLGHPDDTLLADIVRSSTVGDNTGQPDLYVVNATHPIMNGPYGSFSAGYHITGLYSDCDMAEANTTRNATTVAELANGYDKIIATGNLLGKVVYWNGEGSNDWNTNIDCQNMFKNTLDWFGIEFGIHDIAIIDITPSKTVVGQGYSLNINVTAANQGDYTETFNVTVYANTTTIATLLTNITLTSGNSTTITFTWNTTGFVKGNYTIKAVADIVSGEMDAADNTFIDGWIFVAMVGDVDANGKVDMIDLWEEARHFGIDYPDPRYKPNFDIDDNLKIDMLDLWITAKEFGKIDP
jgi:hypothetical protein